MKEFQRKTLIWIVGGQLISTIIIIAWVVGSDSLREFMGNIPFFGSGIALVFLGVIVAVLIKKYNVAKPLIIYLSMSGYSAIYFLPATVAHNFLEVGGEQLGGILGGIMSFLGATFFLTSVIGVPIALLVGIIGSLVLLLRKT